MARDQTRGGRGGVVCTAARTALCAAVIPTRRPLSGLPPPCASLPSGASTSLASVAPAASLASPSPPASFASAPRSPRASTTGAPTSAASELDFIGPASVDWSASPGDAASVDSPNDGSLGELQAAASISPIATGRVRPVISPALLHHSSGSLVAHVDVGDPRLVRLQRTITPATPAATDSH